MGMDQENALRWHSGATGGHVESHFLKANSPDGRRALWIKHTVFAPEGRPDEAVAEVWAIAFDREDPAFPVGGKQTVPITEARFEKAPFGIQTGGSELRSGQAQGRVQQDGNTLRWDLRYEAVSPPFRLFPFDFLYRGAFPKQKAVTPCPDGVFTGELEVNGDRWQIDGWPGMQGHNWGRGHADSYVWAHCNSWDGDVKNVWFEGFSGWVRMGPVTTPWLSTGAIHIDGETLRFDGLRTMLSRQVDVRFDGWRFRFAQAGKVLTGEVVADKELMAGLYYANPSGPTTHCLNSKLARATLQLERPGHPVTTLKTNRIALEVGTHETSHGVRMVA